MKKKNQILKKIFKKLSSLSNLIKKSKKSGTKIEIWQKVFEMLKIRSVRTQPVKISRQTKI